MLLATNYAPGYQLCSWLSIMLQSTVYPRIVSALDQYPPSNRIRTVCFCQWFSSRRQLVSALPLTLSDSEELEGNEDPIDDESTMNKQPFFQTFVARAVGPSFPPCNCSAFFCFCLFHWYKITCELPLTRSRNRNFFDNGYPLNYFPFYWAQ